jgi:dienelactone hydrolase
MRSRFGEFLSVRIAVAAAAFVIFFLSVPFVPRSEPRAGQQTPEPGALRRETWAVPSAQRGVMMRTTLFRPSGPGPFPLVVINHGTTQNAERRRMLKTPDFDAMAHWFARRGFAVAVPQRPGHGETGGDYREDQGGCDEADFARAGLGAAESIAAAVGYLRVQSFVRRTGVIVVGQSAGGWAALALASRAPAGVRAVVDFAGGLGGRSWDRPDNNCAPDRLVATAAEFGRTTRMPTLWIYTENDTYFAARLSGAMAAAFRTAGGQVDYALLPAFGDDGHFMAERAGSESVWGPVVERFLGHLR